MVDTYVEADGVGSVENIPRETQRLRFGNAPNFGQAPIDTEITRTAEVVRLPGFAGISNAKRTGGGRSGLKNIRIAFAVEESSGTSGTRDDAILHPHRQG